MLALYALCRTDLPSLRFGKTVAQAMHAANLFYDEEIIKPLLDKRAPNPLAMVWRNEADGFGTTLAIDVPSLDIIAQVVNAAKKLGFASGVVTDPTYPYVVDNEVFPLLSETLHTMAPVPLAKSTVCFRKEYTIGYVFGEKSEVSVLLSQFKLLNND